MVIAAIMRPLAPDPAEAESILDKDEWGHEQVHDKFEKSVTLYEI